MKMMTREHASPANGGACPKTTKATRATRQVGQTLRIPTAEERRAALLALPAETRDRIGLIALNMVFNAFLSGAAYADEDRVLGADLLAMREASEACDEALMQLHEAVEAALPDLFGAAGEAPAWTVQH